MGRKIWIGILAVALASVGVQAAVIDFEEFEHGEFITMSGDAMISGVNPQAAGNFALAFDSSFTTPRLCGPVRDLDLGTPSGACGGPGNGFDPAVGAGGEFENCTAQGMVLIINERDVSDTCMNFDGSLGSDGLVDSPNDIGYSNSIPEAVVTFTFPFDIVATSIDFIDIDGNGPNPRVELYDADNTLLGTFAIQNNDPGNGKHVVDLFDTPGVQRMEVWIQGSGAIDDIVYQRRGGSGCTPGFWKNHDGSKKQGNYWPVDSLKSGMDTIWDEYFWVCDDTELDPKYLTETIRLKGGGLNKIGRHGTAALLNALHPLVYYPYGVGEVIDMVCSGKMGMLVQANELSDECPAKEGDPYTPPQ